MRHLLSLIGACLVSLSMQAQQTWDFGNLSESIPIISSDATNWPIDKEKDGAPIQWHNGFTTTDWTSLQAGGQDIPATKGLAFNGIRKENALVFSISSSKQNYFKLNSNSLKVKIAGAKAGQKLTIIGITGSSTSERGFTAEENLEVISGFELSKAVQTNVATVKADGDIIFGCTASMNIYSISLSDASSTGITQTALNFKTNKKQYYSMDGKLAKKSQKGIIIYKGKKIFNK